MSGFLLVLAILLIIVIAANLAVRADPAALAKIVRFGGAGLAGLIGLALLFIGRLGAAVPLLLLAFWLLGRPLGLGGQARTFRSARRSRGQQSETRTAFLHMRLDHDSGEMEGEVLAGHFSGCALADLKLGELMRLREELQSDADSLRLLESYLDRTFGPDWRAGADGGRETGASAGGPMTRERALEILGLKPGASAEAIRRAHKELMLKVHPDQGGSTLLAAEVNAAKDFLLGD